MAEDSPEPTSKVVDEKDTTKSTQQPAKTTSLTSPIVQVLVVLSIFATLGVSYGVQYYRDTYVIPPQKERTFPFFSKADFLTTLRNVPSKNYILKFVNLQNLSRANINFQLFAGDTAVSIDDLEYYEFEIPEVEIGGKVSFKHQQLTASITYLLIGEDLELILERNDHSANNYTVSIVEEDVEENPSIAFQTATKGYYRYSNGEVETIDGTEVEAKTEKIKLQWQTKYDSLYDSVSQKMPKPYQVLGEAALSFVRNCFNQKQIVHLLGTYNKNFTFEKNFHFLQSNHIPLSSLDDQVFPLITMAKIDTEDTFKVIRSWIGLVNELGEIGNVFSDDGIQLQKIQAPLLFQLFKELLSIKTFDDKYSEIYENLNTIAENAWKNSIGERQLKNVKWLGHSRGVFQLEPATSQGSSSFELLCLLEDMCNVMQEISKRSGSSDDFKWGDKAEEVKSARSAYWSADNLKFGDLEKNKLVFGRSSHVPLILSLVEKDSSQILQLLQNLAQDPLFTPLGLQISEEFGAPVSTNFLLLQSLKRYSLQSGPGQELAHQMYSQLKNNLIAAIARSNRIEKSFYGRFDKNMRPLGSKGSLDGTLVLPIMTE